MIRIFGIFALCVASLSAVELPLVQVTNLTIKKGSHSYLAFPFEITGVKKTPFVTEVTASEGLRADSIINSEELLNANSLPVPSKRGSKGQAAPVSKSISMEQAKNSVDIFPLKSGTTQIVVYGHKKFPMHINLTVSEKAGASHFFFVDTRKVNGYDQGRALKFEMVSHEKIVSKLMKYAFNNKVPSGYSQTRLGKTYDRKGMRFQLHKKLKGKDYELNEWLVKNTGNGTVTLYEEMFYQNGIYAIAFENNRLNTGEATRMFIVQKAEK